MTPIKVLIVDDHPILRKGLKLILEQYSEIEPLDCVADGLDAVNYCKEYEVDVVIMDVCMEDMDGITATRQIKELNKDIKVLALSTFANSDYVSQIIRAGADGYVIKAIPNDELVKSIVTINAGSSVFAPEAMDRLRDLCKANIFHSREQRIIEFVAKGKTNKSIAIELNLKEGTVKNIISAMLSKAGVGSRSELVAYYQNLL